MKKMKTTRVGNVLKSIINLRLWIDWDRVRGFTLFLWNGFKKFFVPQPTTATETFREAQKKLQLSDADLLARQKGLLRLSILMLLCGIGLFIYAIYQIIYGSFRGHIVALSVTLIAFVLAFRYHFWYFQIKQRKLGCSIKEWYTQGLKGYKK